ncbi:zinc finger protein on ecdysone puffs-like [Vespula maculifrons]|uniref:Zinc finger protein on ecdysone puffs-like n=1 Tax=Vespula maculifrons TaxID=7453 RepID=A0ABD2CGL9_VESMC
MGNRARDGPAGRRGLSAQQSRAPQSGNQRMNGNQNQHRNDKSSKPIPASKQNQTAKKEQQDNKTSDNEKAEAPVVKSELVEESEDKKRDWKDEKNEVEEVKIDKTNDTEAKVIKEDEDEKKIEKCSATAAAAAVTTTTTTTNTAAATNNTATEETSKEANATNSDKDSKATGKKSEARHAESRYAEVPMSHMFCYICNKHMWDGYSFENHLRGRAHQLMMEKLDESYKLKVDLMRHELRVAEEQRGLSLNNSKRRGKKIPVDLNIREYCTMCDLNFYGTLSTHRKSEKHQQLKTFLHPRCFPCLKEFPSRIEYDEHCLTPAHMKNAVQCEEQRKNKKKDKLGKGEAEVRTADDEEKDIGPDQKSEKEDEPGEHEFITDISENLKDKKFKIPSYRYCRQNQLSIGKSLVKEVQGYYCEKCRRFMLLSEDMNAHIRSITHYRNFVQEVKSLTANTTNAESKETEDIETKRDNSSQNSEEYEGNWKRRKVAHSEDEDNGETKETQDNSNESSSVQKKTDGDEKYDPLEADAESEEDENNETSGNNEQTTENVTNEQEKKTPVEKMWADIDNDNDLEIGNLIDDGDEKEHAELEKTTPVSVEVTHTPQMNKSPRGRGYSRGRGGGPRARRSRR